MRSPALALALLAAASWPTPVHAQRGSSVTQEGGGWAEIFEPSRRTGRRMREQGLGLLLQSMRTLHPELGDVPRHVLLDQALLRFERARRRIPDDPELAYYTATALTSWERPAPDGGIEQRADEALDAWRQVRRLDPDLMPERVAYQLAMLHMRRHEFDEARVEYETALRWAVPPTVELAERFYMPNDVERRLAFLYGSLEPANLHGNLAEVLMLTGDVRAAVTHYRAAMRTDEPVTRSLAQWGLALALDRAGDHEEALAQAERAIREDPVPPDSPIASIRALRRRHGAFAVLHLDFVFYEPPYEIHAYEALGREAYARMEPEDRAEHLERARVAWTLFLAEGGTASRFAASARAHLERIEAERASLASSPAEPARRDRATRAPALPPVLPPLRP